MNNLFDSYCNVLLVTNEHIQVNIKKKIVPKCLIGY